MTTPPVIIRVTGRLGRIVLNRPRALNALTLEMIDIIHQTLDLWEESPRIRNVLIIGAGERGLCAGGDIRAIHADAVSGGDDSLEFWRREYQLNARIATYPKPVAAWMDGLVMGGGVGVSAHASHRIVTERTRLAMPEVGIGFHPDVGGSWLLGRAPGEVGVHAGLTGGQLGAGDAVFARLADYFVPSARLPSLLTHLTHRNTGPAVETVAATVPDSDLRQSREWIDQCYAGDDASDIVERLRRRPEAAAQAAAKEISTKSPTSVAVTLRSVKSARQLPFLEAALDQEFRLSAAMLRNPDLAEGIRAQIIDKDHAPRWDPDTLDAVSPSQVDGFFAAVDNELGLASEVPQ